MKRALSHPILWFLKSAEFHFETLRTVMRCMCVCVCSHGKMVSCALTLPIITAPLSLRDFSFVRSFVCLFYFLVCVNCTCIPSELWRTQNNAVSLFFRKRYVRGILSTFGTFVRAILNRMGDKMCHSFMFLFAVRNVEAKILFLSLPVSIYVTIYENFFILTCRLCHAPTHFPHSSEHHKVI